MKTRRSVFWFVIVVAALIALVLWLGKKQPVQTQPTAAVETNAAPPAATATSAPVSAPVHSNATPAAQAVPRAPVPTPPLKTKEQQMREGLAELNDEDVVLYGRVIDQFGSPVAGAAVKGSIQVNNGTRVGSDKISLVTDGNGFFTVSGYKGKALGIYVSKTGYVMATTNTYFVYSLLWPESQRYVPDVGNPTVIKMWKLQGAEPLVSIDKTYKLRYTGVPMNFDLVTGEIVPAGGDLKITVNRSLGEVSEHNPQDWSVQVEAVDGGLIETTVAESRVTYAAPEDGYQPSAAFEMSTTTQSWHAAVDQMFFFESRNGKAFSKVRLILGINETPDGFMDITFSGVANTNGSRNWEATAPQ
ncbi:MAG: carboxypeptidase-like regulatory domain-containing protein [Verrucomicrobiota bacterium]|jgi:hypothetical protein